MHFFKWDILSSPFFQMKQHLYEEYRPQTCSRAFKFWCITTGKAQKSMMKTVILVLLWFQLLLNSLQRRRRAKHNLTKKLLVGFSSHPLLHSSRHLTPSCYLFRCCVVFRWYNPRQSWIGLLSTDLRPTYNRCAHNMRKNDYRMIIMLMICDINSSTAPSGVLIWHQPLP